MAEQPISMPKREALDFAEKIKKDCLSRGVWVKCQEVHKNELDFINMELSIKVEK